MTDTTLLVIAGPGVPPYSARGLRQTLEPIAASQVQQRTVNGRLVNLSPTQMRKFRSEISCSDQQAPALNGVYPGDELVVDCVVELAYPTATGTADRPIVESRVEGDFTFYRPRLTFLVVEYQIDRDEYGAVVQWHLSLEEV
jgi:hypothetical protein